jgi:hypothetical protein
MSEKQPWMLKKTRQRASDRRANNQPPEHSRFQPRSPRRSPFCDGSHASIKFKAETR